MSTADEAIEQAPRRRRRPWREIPGTTDLYGLVLGLVVLVLVLPALLPTGSVANAVVSVVAGVAIVVALRSSRVPAWLFWSAVAIAVVATAALALGTEVDEPGLDAAALTGYGFLLVITPVAILNRIARHRRITLRTIFGAICVYVMIGIAFSFFFQAMDRLDPDALQGIEQEEDRTAYNYYSFVTQTTLGYGDIVPTTDGARTMAVVETLIGQVFLVVVVARIVSMLGQERPETREPRPDPD